jgi:oxygen-independent coproporphyrinogen-3 oxidase
MTPLALYVHIPFCRTRCSYCTFNTYAGLDRLIPDYVEAVIRECEWLGTAGQHPEIHTVFLGGGTPSILSPDQVATLLEGIRRAFVLELPVEITLEANPAHFSAAYYAELRECGVNRISFGAQSAHEPELRLFNRTHDWEGAVAAVDAARQGGIDDVSLDLIYGAPGQTLDNWQISLEKVLALCPEHVSLYSLSLEPGAAMYRWVQSGLIEELDSDLAADMYEMASDRLANAGFVQYEISNWALPGYECRHNLQYWRNQPYLGVGAGAYGSALGWRYATLRSPAKYIRAMEAIGQVADLPGCFPLSPAVDPEEVESVDEPQARSETMFLGLRLLQEGVARAEFERRFGQPVEAYYGSTIEKLTEQGLITVDAECIRLTPRSRLIANRVFIEFV